MNFTITGILNSVDQFGTSFVQQAYVSLANNLTGGAGQSVVTLLMILYVIWWGIGIWQGTAKGGPTEHAFRLLRMFAIYALATQWSDFQAFAYRALNEGPSAIGTSLLSSVSSASQSAGGSAANISTTDGVKTALQNLYETVANSVSSFVKTGGVTNPGPYVLAGIMYVSVVMLIAFAVFLIILSKIFMWILLALAPIFIILLLFGYTTRFFQGWISTILQYFLVQVFVYSFIAFYVSITQQYLDRVVAANNAGRTTWSEAAPLILIALIGFYLLTQIQSAATNIVGGAPLRVATPGYFFGNATAAFRMLDRAQGRALGTTTRAERQGARLRVRRELAEHWFRESAEYKALAKKLSV